MTRSIVRAILSLCCIYCCQRTANAVPITLQVSGVVEQVTDDSDLLSPAVTVGLPFVATLKYDSDVPDSEPEDDQRGEYRQTTAVRKFIIDVGGLHFETYPESSLRVFASNGVPIEYDEQGQPTSFGDGIGIHCGEMFGSIPFNTCFAALSLTDSSGTALDNDAFPLTIDPNLFDTRQLSLWGVQQGGLFINLVLRADTITAVPEPDSICLMIVSLLAVLGWHSQSRAR